MNSENMERLIKNLGCSYDALIANGVIGNLPLQDLYEDGESLEVEPGPGIELIFWPETLRFEAIYITIHDDLNPDLPVYTGALPCVFGSVSNRNEVRHILGDPIISKSPMELSGTGLGGWDQYQVPPDLQPAALIDFQYSKNFSISKIFIGLIDRNT